MHTLIKHYLEWAIHATGIIMGQKKQEYLEGTHSCAKRICTPIKNFLAEIWTQNLRSASNDFTTNADPKVAVCGT